MRRHVATIIVLIVVAFGFRLYLVLTLPNDDDDDSRFYSRIAHNLVENRGYSGEEEPPYVPTYVRVPGYPLLLAAVYQVFNGGNDRAVRIIQATADTATCLLIGLLAFAWSPVEWQLEKRRRAMLLSMALAAACPFTAIYVTTILTETWATMLVTAFALVATLALRSERAARAAPLWFAAGLVGGTATMFRPDCALFAGGAGVMLLITLFQGVLLLRRPPESTQRRGSSAIIASFIGCLMLSVGFLSVLAPWTVRNARVFGVLQPVAPQHANMPDEFAPLGYIDWLRTWVDDERYVTPIEDGLDLYPISIDHIPAYAFDSAEERDRVALLLDRYNNPSKSSAGSADDNDEASDPGPPVKMTPEIDADFEQIARDRISRRPLRYYIGLPVERAASLWFGTHSQYYPFQGELFPLSDLDTDAHQQYWLTLFALLTVFYTAIALIGGYVMWITGASRRWVVLFVLLILPRLAFLAAQEHPESRYTVEFMALVLAAGGVALARLRLPRITDKAGDRTFGEDV